MIQPVGSVSYGRMAARYEQERGGEDRARVIADAQDSAEPRRASA